MVEMKEAVSSAKAFVKELYVGEGISEITLEEITKSEDGSKWLVTVGFTSSEKASRTGQLRQALEGAPLKQRDYKIVEVNADGTIDSMKMRQL